MVSSRCTSVRHVPGRGGSVTLCGILENIVSDVAFWLLTIAVVRTWYILTYRRKLLSFFGADSTRRFLVYVSHLDVRVGGAAGIDGVERSYSGAAVPMREMSEAGKFRDLFNFLFPSLSESSGVLRHLLVSDVRVDVVQLSEDCGELDCASSFVTLGSPAYNGASKFVQEKLNSYVKYYNDYDAAVCASGGEGAGSGTGDDSSPAAEQVAGLQASVAGTATGAPWFGPERRITARASRPRSRGISSSGSAGRPSSELPPPCAGQGPSSTTSYPARCLGPERDASRLRCAIVVPDIPPLCDEGDCFVQRIVDPVRGLSAFYVAGHTEKGTAMAARHLTSSWRDLEGKHGGNKSFLRVLRVDDSVSGGVRVVFDRDF